MPTVSTPQKSKGILPSLGLLFVSLIWGTTFVAVKSALDDIPPMLFLGLRFGMATCLAAFFVRRGPGLRSALLWGVPLGFVLAAAYAAQTIGLLTTTPARSGFITGLNVVLIPFWGFWILRQRIGIFPALGLALVVPGMWLLADPGSGKWVVGDSLTIVCAIFFALHVVLVTRFGSTHDVYGILFSQLAVTAILSFGASAILETPTLRLSVQVLLALAITGILASFLTNLLQLKLQPKVSSTRTALIFATEPLFAALASGLVLGEQLGTIGWVGGVMILFGMIVSERGDVSVSEAELRSTGEIGPVD